MISKLVILVGLLAAFVGPQGVSRRAAASGKAVDLDRIALRAIVPEDQGLPRDETKVPNSPPVYSTPMRDVAAEKCGKCDYLYHASGNIDLLSIQTDVINELRKNALDTAFAGSAAGELVVNSTAIAGSPDVTYCQVRVIAANYDAQAKTFDGTLFIDASLIRLQNNTASQAPENALTLKIERLILQRTKVTLTAR